MQRAFSSKFVVFPFLVILASSVVATHCRAANSYVYFISETGTPHAAILIQHDDGTLQWLGFRPRTSGQIDGPGLVDTSSRQELIESYVGFQVDAATAARAEGRAIQKYSNAVYRLGVQDCVNLAADFARDCGLQVPAAGNFLPSKFVNRLARDNQPVVSVFDARPFPWVIDRQILNTPISVQVKHIRCLKTETITGPDKIYVKLPCSDGQAQLPPARIPIGNGQLWNPNLQLTTNRGHAIAIQVWDDDQFDPDDLVFDWSLPTSNPPVSEIHGQVRGTSVNGSESNYEVGIEFR